MWGLAWASDSRRLVTGSNDGTAKVWLVDAPAGVRALTVVDGDAPSDVDGVTVRIESAGSRAVRLCDPDGGAFVVTGGP